MKMNVTEYIAPQIEYIEINMEGVLCQSAESADTEVGDGGDAF